jgi:hypothetical protein
VIPKEISDYQLRSGIHAYTNTQGKSRPDAPHIMIAVKDEKQRQEQRHEASHGYTNSMQSAAVTKVVPSGYSKADSTKDSKGKEVWPTGLTSEEVAHNG